ncbi:hypothetical protein EDD22DRAFT_852357 [Suillus occidentalis]|nr:hypothetical protein EDD22DRAFT_852357 [Suillus occidentalis]
MCWDNTPYQAQLLMHQPSAHQQHRNTMAKDTNTTPTKGQYDLCWDEPSSSQALSIPAITAEAATPPRPAAASYDLCWKGEPPQPMTTDAGDTSTTSKYEMCWDDQPAALATAYQGGFDMCWGDSAAGDGLHQVHPTAVTNTSSVNSVQLAPSAAPSEDLVTAIARVEAREIIF